MRQLVAQAAKVRSARSGLELKIQAVRAQFRAQL